MDTFFLGLNLLSKQSRIHRGQCYARRLFVPFAARFWVSFFESSANLAKGEIFLPPG